MLYQTHVRVYLNHIADNIRSIRQAVGAQRKILIAVKANAYGHGAVEVARMAEQNGVDWLGVATVPEGLQLRAAGLRLPVLKMNPTFVVEMEAAVQADLTLMVCERANVEQLEAVCAAAGKQTAVHLKLDTGMGRVGVGMEEANNLAVFIDQGCPHLNLQGIFTHLPVSDDPDPAYTTRQIASFKKTLDWIQTAIGRRVELAHCSNSGGVLGHVDGWMDMVRPGIMIYGYYPSRDTPRTMQLKPGLGFFTRVSFLKKVKAGARIGYGLTWTAPADCWIATLAVGYADGFTRLFSNRGRVLINGRSYPIAGRVCMDQCMANLGGETDVRVGDEVVLIGQSGAEEISCEEWAEKLGTIPYEVTCQLNPRGERVYVR